MAHLKLDLLKLPLKVSMAASVRGARAPRTLLDLRGYEPLYIRTNILHLHFQEVNAVHNATINVPSS